MPPVKKLIKELSEANPRFKEAQAVAHAAREVSSLLERMRERSGLTQAELGEKLNLSPGRISQLESGSLRDAPSLKTLMRIAQACGETIEISASGENSISSKEAREEDSVPHQLMIIREVTEQLTQLRSEIRSLEEKFALGRSALIGLEEKMALGRSELFALEEKLSWRKEEYGYLTFEPRADVFGRSVKVFDSPIKAARVQVPQQGLAQSLDMAAKSVLMAAGIEKYEVTTDNPTRRNPLKVTVIVK